MQEVSDRCQRHGDLPERDVLGSLQFRIPQLQRDVREQQRPRDVRPHRVYDRVPETHGRQRDLQRNRVRTGLPRQRTSALRGRLYRPDCGLCRQVSRRTKILCGQRLVYRDQRLLYGQRLRRYDAILFGRAMRPVHHRFPMRHQQDLQQQQSVCLCGWHLRFQLRHLQWRHSLLLDRWSVRPVHGCLAMRHQQDL